MPLRRPVLLALVLALITPAAAGARPDRPPARAAVRSCDQGAAPAERVAVFRGRMRALADAPDARLQMRFALQTRPPGAARWQPVALAGWAGWLTSAPGVPAYVYDRRVANLAAPAAYRAVVRFRWLDADGEVLARARAASGSCRQSDLRPDLVVRDLQVAPARRRGRQRYVAVVANVGGGAAGRFSVAVSADGRRAGTATADGLAAGDQVRLRMSGPACPAGSTATAEADPGDAVTESDETDNALTIACPAP
jgi:CARDB